jgi:hypothetical protein
VSSPSMPESLRAAISDDLQPVRPLLPVWMRTLTAVAVAAAGLAAVVLLLEMSLRPDMDRLPMWLGWGCAAVQLAVGVVLIGMAIREAVPGNAVPGGAVKLAVGVGVVMQILVGIATWMHTPGVPFVKGQAIAAGVGCATHDVALGLPALAVTLWLVFRALPLRPSIAGLLGGTGAAVTADAINHIVCPMSDLRHVLVWHTGVIFGLMVVGWLTGMIWERVRFGNVGSG